jgi:hypothetical protein
MGNIIINIDEFQCESPIVGDTFRQGNVYTFNWTSKGNEYQALGLVAEMRLFYKPEIVLPEEQYTAVPIPFNANSFVVDQLLGYDQVSFRLEFLVDGGDTCYYSIDIPYSSIIIT